MQFLWVDPISLTAKCTCDYADICQVLSEQVHSQYFTGCKYISMEGVALEDFNKLKPFTIPMSQFHSHWYDWRDQYDSTNYSLYYYKTNGISISGDYVVSHGWLR